jgi:hypothetical protein
LELSGVPVPSQTVQQSLERRLLLQKDDPMAIQWFPATCVHLTRQAIADRIKETMW